MDKFSLAGKKVVITGASRGLGYEISRGFIDAGADILMCARDSSALKKASDELRAFAKGSQIVVNIAADVSVEGEVEGLVDFAFDTLGDVDVLINNAGVYGPLGEIEKINWSEWVKAVEINLFGSILMSRAIVSHFKAKGRGKIIQLSGGGATAPLPRISAYAASKAAVVRFTETLAEELREHGIDVNCIAPGALNTAMLEEIIDAGPEKVGRDFYAKAIEQKQSGGNSLAMAVSLALFLASDQSKGITGKLISAVWDEWREWPSHIDMLRNSDVYTLRRITMKERGNDWGGK